jgi:DHA1 family multidrug resistance protein-like MFS transporter
MEQNYISTYADQNTIGTISGIRQSFVSIGNVIGPLFGGVLYSVRPLLLFDVSGILFLVGALILVIILLVDKRHITKTL